MLLYSIEFLLIYFFMISCTTPSPVNETGKAKANWVWD